MRFTTKSRCLEACVKRLRRRLSFSESAGPPAAMLPQPLLRASAHPALDHPRHRLRRALNIDAPVRVARQVKRRSQFDGEADVRMPDDPRAVHGTVEPTGKPGEDGIG